MVLHGFWQVFFGGMLGPFLLELLKIAAWHDKKKIEARYRKLTYWVATLALFIVAGVVASINGVDNVPLQQAVQLGINAPAIVAAYATSSKGHRKEARAALGEDERRRFVKPGMVERITDLLSWW